MSARAARRAAGGRGAATRPGAPARPAPAPRVFDALTLAVIAIVTGVLLAIALGPHRIGDYFTESDFYGSYATGAAALRSGHLDPSRYGVVGPGYEVAVASLGLLVRDLFTAGELVSVAASVIALLALAWWTRRRLGSAAAFVAVLLLGANATFLRYGFSATTDALAAGACGLAIALVAAPPGRAAPFAAGVAAAVAALTRYNTLAALPALVVVTAWLERPAGLTRARATLALLAGFLTLAAPWTAYSLARGAVPGAGLARNAAFYAARDASRNVQDLPVASDSVTAAPAPAPTPPRAPSLPAAFVEHLRSDAALLLGWPLAALALAGLALAALDPARRAALLPALLPCALLFAALVPVFYSTRYQLVVLPVWAALAAAAVTWPRLEPTLGARRWPAGVLLALAVAALAIRDTRAELRFVLDQLPVEVLDAGAVLRADSAPTARVVARKNHIGYVAGRAVVPFPRVPDLAALAAYCRRERADHLFFSWYEAELRPEFWWLLDTTATVPGLAIAHVTERHPSVLYRIGPGFGAAPDWFANDTLRAVHAANAQVWVLPDTMTWRPHLLLGVWALSHGRRDDAVRHLEAVRRLRPDLPSAARALELARALPAR